MITEDHVSYEVARLLKEKGFDEPCRTYYQDEKFVDDVCTKYYQWNSKSPFGHISAPTLQMTMKWLREVHNIAIDTEWEHLWYVYVKPMTANPFEDDYCQCFSAKYEEAVEAALKYSLENLI